MKNKIILGILAVLVIGGIFFASTNSILFQGRLSPMPVTVTSGNFCSSSWTKTLDGFISSPSGVAQLNSVTAAQIKSLETAVENGCDLKVQLITYNDDKGANYVCDDVVLMKNDHGEVHVSCKSKTPFSFGEPELNHLFDEVVFSENNGTAYVAINRNWTGGGSTYSKDANSLGIGWTVRAFLKK